MYSFVAFVCSLEVECNFFFNVFRVSEYMRACDGSCARTQTTIKHNIKNIKHQCKAKNCLFELNRVAGCIWLYLFSLA